MGDLIAVLVIVGFFALLGKLYLEQRRDDIATQRRRQEHHRAGLDALDRIHRRHQ